MSSLCEKDLVEFFLNVPVIDFIIKNKKDDVEEVYQAVFSVEFIYSEDRLTVLHELYLYSESRNVFVALPEGWDLAHKDITYLIENHFNFGKLISKNPTKHAKELSGFEIDNEYVDYILLADLSNSLSKAISEKMNRITNVKPRMLYSTLNSFSLKDNFHAYDFVF